MSLGFNSARRRCHGDCFQLSQDGCSSLAAVVNIAQIHNISQTGNSVSLSVFGNV